MAKIARDRRIFPSSIRKLGMIKNTRDGLQMRLVSVELGAHFKVPGLQACVQ